MKAITLHQPWASLITLGKKKIETRSWYTNYRGPLAIHASKSRRPWHMNLAWQEPFFSALAPIHHEIDGKIALRYSFGCVIATCRLVNCLKILGNNGCYIFIGHCPFDFQYLPVNSNECHFGDYTPGRYAWILEDIKPLPESVPAKGRQRLWEWVPPEGVLESE